MPLNLRLCFLMLAVFVSGAGCKKSNSIPATLSVFPLSDTVGGIITITGSGFSSNRNDNIVMFNDSVGGFVISATPTQLTVTVSGHNTRNPIVVKTNGKEWKTAQEFQVAPRFYPQTEAPGYPITIAMSGDSILSDYSISFNGSSATPSKWSPEELTVEVPVGAKSGAITVTYKGQPYTTLTSFAAAPVGQVFNVVTPLGIFSAPSGLAFDKNGSLYVVDPGMIYKINPSTGYFNNYAGVGPYYFDGGSPLLTAGIDGILQIGFAPDGNMYATDPPHNIIWKITADSANPIRYLAGQFTSPTGLTIDGSGNLYVTDLQQIKKVATNGSVTGLATYGYLYRPSSVALDGAGNIYLADVSHIETLRNGIPSLVAGSSTGYKDGNGNGARFGGPINMVLDPVTGDIYATDSVNHVVRRITPAGDVTTVAGNPGRQGNQNGIGNLALFEGPNGIALDSSGNIFVTDGTKYNNSGVRKIVLH